MRSHLSWAEGVFGSILGWRVAPATASQRSPLVRAVGLGIFRRVFARRGCERCAVTSANKPPKRKGRRWLQFSLRSLLLFTGLCAGALGLWKVYLAPYYRQRPAIEELKGMGIEYHLKPAEDPRWVGWLVGKEYFVRVIGVTDRDRTHHYSGEALQRLLWIFERLPFLEWLSFRGDFSDDDLVHLKHMDRLTMVALPYSRIEGDGLSHLARATHLRNVQFYGCASFGDAGLERLKHHQELESLELQKTQVTDEGLRALQELPRLERLRLNDTAITDAGLEHVGRLHQLERLFLEGTQITDAGLVHLEGLRSLEWLRLSNTAITGEGLVHLGPGRRRLILGLDGTRIRDETVLGLRYLPPYTKVDLEGTDVSVEAIRYLDKLRPDLSIHARAQPRYPVSGKPTFRALLARQPDLKAGLFDAGYCVGYGLARLHNALVARPSFPKPVRLQGPGGEELLVRCRWDPPTGTMTIGLRGRGQAIVVTSAKDDVRRHFFGVEDGSGKLVIDGRPGGYFGPNGVQTWDIERLRVKGAASADAVDLGNVNREHDYLDSLDCAVVVRSGADRIRWLSVLRAVAGRE